MSADTVDIIYFDSCTVQEEALKTTVSCSPASQV